jgi:hypothetical protein
VPPPPDDELQWEDCMFQGCCHYCPYWWIVDAIWSGNAIIGTDGSASNDNGTYSFVILTDIPPSLSWPHRYGFAPPWGSSSLCLPLLCLPSSVKVPMRTDNQTHSTFAFCPRQQKCHWRWSQMGIRRQHIRVQDILIRGFCVDNFIFILITFKT